MISKIIQIVITIILIIISFKFFIKEYKESESAFEKVLYVAVFVAFMIPIIIYYLDRYNIPSILGHTANLNSENWVGILTNYLASIISVLLSSTFLLIITAKQIDITNKQNMEINNEIQRIQNLPLLKYDFTYDRLDANILNDNHKFLFSKNENEINGSLDFTMEIENIGLNTVRKVYLEVESDLLRKKEIFEFCNQSNIEKHQILKKNFIIANVIVGDYKFNINVYYQDLLKNWYKQCVCVNVSLTNIYDSEKRSSVLIKDFSVEDDKLLINCPDIIKDLNQ